ncbi:MAG TPA: hypothetical protein VE685_09605 [Thermoanaerobaculia bacterium]|nr:hypothetical protein [Thermoanaerobaculia bacterium]
MKRKIPHARLVIALILVSTFLPVVSSAAPRETPRAGMRAEIDWLGSTFAWLSRFLEGADLDRPQPERSGPPSTMTKAENETSVNGVCIDPMGRPRPCPDP